MSKIDLSIFRQRYALPLEAKILLTKDRYRKFYDHFDGNVFLCLSGGKDSQVLAHIIRSMRGGYGDIEFVFFDTHNEHPSVLEIVKRYGATVVPAPLTPAQVVEQYGYPLFNKEIAKFIHDIKANVPYTNDPNASNADLISKIKVKYADFINSPLPISHTCCDVLKKQPSKEFTLRTGKYPVLATLAVESRMRFLQYLNHGCNSFEGKIQSTPMGFWSTANVLEYVGKYGLRLASVYCQGVSRGLFGSGQCKLYGKTQTGCMFCGFGKGFDFAYKILKAKCPEYYKSLNRGD